MHKTETSTTIGIVPEDGYITGEELAKRLQLRNFRNLQDELKKRGIPHALICGKYVYQCSSLKKLFNKQDKRRTQ